MDWIADNAAFIIGSTQLFSCKYRKAEHPGKKEKKRNSDGVAVLLITEACIFSNQKGLI